MGGLRDGRHRGEGLMLEELVMGRGDWNGYCKVGKGLMQ
jgi:hypothetical protein